MRYAAIIVLSLVLVGCGDPAADCHGPVKQVRIEQSYDLVICQNGRVWKIDH